MKEVREKGEELMANFIKYKDNIAVNLNLVQYIYEYDNTKSEIRFSFPEEVIYWKFNSFEERDYVLKDISNKFHFWSPQEYNN